MTSEIATENGVDIDLNGFNSLMDTQKKRSRESSRFETSTSKIDEYKKIKISQINFVGYDLLNKKSTVVGIIENDKFVNNTTQNGKNLEIITDSTTFYPEGGGQVGDSGLIFNDNFKFEVQDTQEVIKGIITHIGVLKSGNTSLGDKVINNVDEQNRKDSGRNHTATHLLHSALRKRLGNHVRQAGSLVEPDRLRFDFSHPKALSKAEISDVQNLVSNQINLDSSIRKSEDKYNDAIKRGALAFFGDRYDQTVRLIEIGDESTFSFEVCGGTHVKSTGELGQFIIVSESSIGAGLRRIEAYSGRRAKEFLDSKIESLNNLSKQLNCKPEDIKEKIELLSKNLDLYSEKIDYSKTKIINMMAKEISDKSVDQNEIKIVSNVVNLEPAMLKELSDKIQDYIPDSLIILGTPTTKGPVVIVKSTKKALMRGYDAREIVKMISEIINGRGGGKPEMAQAGGDDNTKLINIENIDLTDLVKD